VIGNVAGPWGPPTHAALVLKEAAHGIKSSARASARQQQALALSFYDDFFLPELIQGHIGGMGLCGRSRSDDDGTRGDGGTGVLEAEGGAGDLV